MRAEVAKRKAKTKNKVKTKSGFNNALNRIENEIDSAVDGGRMWIYVRDDWPEMNVSFSEFTSISKYLKNKGYEIEPYIGIIVNYSWIVSWENADDE